MRSLILANALQPVADILGVCVTSERDRIVSAINDAEERLLNRPMDPVGSWMRYRICAGSSSCLSWPRQLRTIKAFWVCRTPGRVVTDFYEAVGWDEGGYGLREADSYDGSLLIDQGFACSFDNVIATVAEPRKIQVVATNASDNGKNIHLRYFDSNGNRVYTTIDGTVQEGENLTLSTSGTLTASSVMTNGLYHVVKASTNYPVRAYSYDTNSATQSALLAVYEPSETEPIYRQSLLPGLTNMAACPDASSDCTVNKTVTVLARVRHVTLINDNDPMVLQNLPALTDMVQSILMKRRHEYAAAREMEASAIAELDGELSAHMGDGVAINPRFPPVDAWGGGGVVNGAF